MLLDIKSHTQYDHLNFMEIHERIQFFRNDKSENFKQLKFKIIKNLQTKLAIQEAELDQNFLSNLIDDTLKLEAVEEVKRIFDNIRSKNLKSDRFFDFDFEKFVHETLLSLARREENKIPHILKNIHALSGVYGHVSM